MLWTTITRRTLLAGTGAACLGATAGVAPAHAQPGLLRGGILLAAIPVAWLVIAAATAYGLAQGS